MSDVAMPDWAPPEGPWCLKRWLPFRVENAGYDHCLLLRGHDGDCETIHYGPMNTEYGLLLGQGEMRAGSTGGEQ